MNYFVLIAGLLLSACATPGQDATGSDERQPPAESAIATPTAAAQIKSDGPVTTDKRKCPDRVDVKRKRPSVAVGLAADLPIKKGSTIKPVIESECVD